MGSNVPAQVLTMWGRVSGLNEETKGGHQTHLSSWRQPCRMALVLVYSILNTLLIQFHPEARSGGFCCVRAKTGCLGYVGGNSVIGRLAFPEVSEANESGC